uniref:NGF domain-containing protein n=1 Tax=Steinernema glaseri TaxID=37863 RepID=A0A1I7YGB0_9BILA
MAQKIALFSLVATLAVFSAEELLVEQKIEVCEQTTQWEFLEEAETIDKRVVAVVQREGQSQPFYIVRCARGSEGLPCTGVPSRSRCETRYNLVPALVESADSEFGMEWAMIRIPGQCVCTRLINITIAV